MLLPPVSRPAIILSSVLALQAVLAYSTFLKDEPPVPPQLETIPRVLGEWRQAEQYPIEKDVLEYLRPDQYINWSYTRPVDNTWAYVFIPYFRSLRTEFGPHAPKHCLPGAGWLIRTAATVELNTPGLTTPLPVNEYVMMKNQGTILVLYWYQNQRHVWASEIMAKLYLLPDLVRYHRSDVALVRVIVPVMDGNVPRAREISRNFIGALMPELVERFR